MWEYFPSILKIERKGKGKLHIYCLHYKIFTISVSIFWRWTTFRFVLMLMIQVLHKTGLFQHLFNSLRFLKSFCLILFFTLFNISSFFFCEIVYAFFDSFANRACVRIKTLVLLIKIFNQILFKIRNKIDSWKFRKVSFIFIPYFSEIVIRAQSQTSISHTMISLIWSDNTSFFTCLSV